MNCYNCYFCGAQMTEDDVVHEQDGGRTEVWVCPRCGSTTTVTHIPSDEATISLFDEQLDDEQEETLAGVGQ